MKNLLFIFFYTLTLLGSTSVAKYEVEHTLLGKIAQADIVKSLNNNHYTAELIIKTTDLAATFSNNLEKRFISQGELKDGIFYPDVLAVIEKRDDQEKYLIYRFEHEEKILYIDKCSNIKITEENFNPINFSFDMDEYTEFTYNSHRSKSYVKDDVITLFFNAKKYIQKHHHLEEVSFMAAGIYDEDDDEIDGLLSFGISQKDIRNIIQTSISNSMLSVALSEKVFHDDDKWLFIDLNEDSLPQYVKLNDIAFGDVSVKRILESVASSKQNFSTIRK